MTLNLDRFLNSTAFIFLSGILFCLILLTPADAIYQCYKSKNLTNIFFIAGAYIITFIFAILIYATRIYTNRNALTGIPKSWIPVEKEDVGKSVRRLVVEGFARSAIIAYQARPRDTSEDKDSFANYPTLVVDGDRPPWGHVEHPGWSSPSSIDLPHLPYRTVVQELPHLIEAKAVSLAPPDPFFFAARAFAGGAEEQDIPDTRVVEVLQRPAEMGLREYISHLTTLNVVQPPEVGAEFVALYERARFSPHELYEDEFRELMHVFAEVLKGMTSIEPQMVDEIRGGGESSRGETESVIGPSDEEGETDTVDSREGSEIIPVSRGRSNSLRPSNASTWEGRSLYTAPTGHSPAMSRYRDPHPHSLTTPRTPSMRSLRRQRSNVSGSSGGSVIRLADTHGPTDLPYTIHLPR